MGKKAMPASKSGGPALGSPSAALHPTPLPPEIGCRRPSFFGPPFLHKMRLDLPALKSWNPPSVCFFQTTPLLPRPFQLGSLQKCCLRPVTWERAAFSVPQSKQLKCPLFYLG